MVDANRIHRQITALASISEPCEAGVTRPVYTNAFRRAADYVTGEMRAAGLNTYEDSAGNIYGVWEGTDRSAPPIITGSHLDTVQCGGAYDGATGVVCALEAVRALKESGVQLKSTLQVLATAGEEGTRFGYALLGSSQISGAFHEDAYDSLTDRNGATLRDVLSRYHPGGAYPNANRCGETIKAFVELHVEQGPVLDRTGNLIGVVSRIMGVYRLRVTAVGTAGHAGAHPMKGRRDAGIAAFHLIVNLDRYVSAQFPDGPTLTVGTIGLQPGSVNVIPSKCEFVFDIRTGERSVLNTILTQMESEMAAIFTRTGVVFHTQVICDILPVMMDARLCKQMETECISHNIPHLWIDSGAGHDAMSFSQICRAGMLFLPSRDGITHNPQEFTSLEALCAGADLLSNILCRIDAD